MGTTAGRERGPLAGRASHRNPPGSRPSGAGHPIRFFAYLRHGAITVAASLVISTAHVWLRYLA